jgi:1-deoxy-D-xylulose-5-phosphate reductoisomerase
VKRVVVLGSTGSIGTQVLEVAEAHPSRVRVVALAAGHNVGLLAQQVKQFRPLHVSVAREEDAQRLREMAGETEVHAGAAGLLAVATTPADLVIGGLVGSAGLEPVLAALRAGTDLALANKEVLVMAGPLVLREAERSGARVLPLDSEHVAIHQALAGHRRAGVRKLWLTASGGPFRGWAPERIRKATPEQALNHPNWSMGPKISVDSATLMNKGFEVIEARWLFDLQPERIEVLIHPESVVHSLVEFRDGGWLAQLSVPDMRIPIAYILGMPDRLELPSVRPLDLAEYGAFHFEAPDPARFPALRLAADAARAGGTAPAVLNAADEVAVRAFLERRIPFPAIVETAAEVLEAEPVRPATDLAEIRAADHDARARALRCIEERYA